MSLSESDESESESSSDEDSPKERARRKMQQTLLFFLPNSSLSITSSPHVTLLRGSGPPLSLRVPSGILGGDGVRSSSEGVETDVCVREDSCEGVGRGVAIVWV